MLTTNLLQFRKSTQDSFDIEDTAMHSELKKFVRGTWQPTMFSILITDLCEQMKDTMSIVYDVWAKHIISEDIQCLAKGRKYDHEPFSLIVDYNVRGINMEGRYKIVNFFRAYDKKNREKPNGVCVEAPEYEDSMAANSSKSMRAASKQYVIEILLWSSPQHLFCNNR
uniref:Uncharacterized protein n=1 Tax=Glossina austeni TaxID=7395 RepID=A0A1A9VSM8_GLOAU